ncbi:MAG: hypothetical protein VX938_07820 [Myxococcota bacterium]|nr:hypothetical protein [Myxococcota bacterium]MEE2779501.1 hypothetical protein [Myxococcota bacterium]
MKSTERDGGQDLVTAGLSDLPRLSAPEGLTSSVLILTGGSGLLSHGSGRALVSINLALLASLSALYLLVVPSPASALSPVAPLKAESRAQTPPYNDADPNSEDPLRAPWSSTALPAR